MASDASVASVARLARLAALTLLAFPAAIAPPVATAQPTAPARDARDARAAEDTLRLSAMHAAALQRDPRARQLATQDSAAALRLRNIDAERRPALRLGTLASYQSEVASLPLALPGVELPRPPRDRYEATLEVEQRLYDGGLLARRREVERAQLLAERARIAAALHPLRAEVNQAWFRVALLQARGAEVAALMHDLEARLELLRAQVRGGVALPSDTAEVRAELLRARQGAEEVAAGRRTALALLAELTGHHVDERAVLALPDLAAEVARAASPALRGDADASLLRAHPRHLVYDAQREQLRRQSALVDARLRPQLSAFGQLGYGRPGLRQFTDEFHEYWTAGIRMRWQPWTWGTSRRDRELLRLQGELLDADEQAFARQLRRQALGDLEDMSRLESALALDDEIIVLREQVERRARAQLEERVITPAAYVAARTDLLEARIARQRHRIELALARAQLLTTLGVDLP